MRPCGCVGGRVTWQGGWLVTAAVARGGVVAWMVDLTCQLCLGQVRGRSLGGARIFLVWGPESKMPATKVRVRGNMAAHPLKSHPVR